MESQPEVHGESMPHRTPNLKPHWPQSRTFDWTPGSFAAGRAVGSLAPVQLTAAVPVRGSAAGLSEPLRRSSHLFRSPYARICASVGISINLLTVSTRLSCLRYPLCDISLSPSFTLHYCIQRQHLSMHLMYTAVRVSSPQREILVEISVLQLASRLPLLNPRVHLVPKSYYLENSIRLVRTSR